MARKNPKINAPAEPSAYPMPRPGNGSDDGRGAANDRASPIVFEREGQIRTTSREVAERFGKNHRDVLRAIDDLIKSEPSLEGGLRSFAQTPFVEPSTGQTYRQYEMNRDGFSLLCMGFTGKPALRFKLDYIEAFNRMESMIQGNTLALVTGLAEKIERDLGISKSLMREVTALKREVARLDERHVSALVATDPRHRAVAAKTSLEVLVDQDVPVAGRRILSQRVSSRLKTYCKQRGVPVHEMAYPRRNLFPVEAIQGWLRDEGAAMIRDHIDHLEGRPKLPFTEPKVVRLRP